jgi:hypothetical protein
MYCPLLIVSRFHVYLNVFSSNFCLSYVSDIEIDMLCFIHSYTLVVCMLAYMMHAHIKLVCAIKKMEKSIS